MANKKISELADASLPLGGTEYAEILQGGINMKVPVAQFGNTRETGRTWDSELLFNKDEIKYTEHTLTGDVEFTIAETGNIEDRPSVVFQSITTDGTHEVTFTGFEFVPGGIQSGDVPAAGTYLVSFLKWGSLTIANWATPTSQTSQLTALSAPASFAATVFSSTQVNLAWTNNVNASSYEVSYSIDQTNWSVAVSKAAGSTSHSFTGLTAGTLYYFRIRAMGDLVQFSNSQYSTANATTTAAGDVTAPVATFTPANAATDIPINRAMVVDFDEAIIDSDGVTVITDANVNDYRLAKQTNAAGSDIANTSTINAGKNQMRIVPNVIWGLNQAVFIRVFGIEDVNGNEAGNQEATFTTNDFTENVVNHLNFGNILNSIISANDARFRVRFTAKALLTTAGTTIYLFRKHETGQEALLVTMFNRTISFKFYTTAALREIIWTDVIPTDQTTGHTYDFDYDGSIDTNNGLDRLVLRIDGSIQGSKTIAEGTTNTAPFPFSIKSTTSVFKFGPTSGQVKDILITSANDTVDELDVPIVRTGTDVSGNNRDGTYV